jgi:hypothetical protein
MVVEQASRTRLAAIAAAVALAALSAAGCGGGDDDARPEPSDVPDNSVAVVGETEITRDELDKRVAALRRVQSRPVTTKGNKPAPAPANANQLEQQALATLVLAAALEQEAADRDIELTSAEVRQRWEAAAQQFPNAKARRTFLGGQTERDVLDQLRLQLLTERIHAQVAEEAGGGKQGERAVKQFDAEFRKRWRERTACKQDGAASLCGSS